MSWASASLNPHEGAPAKQLAQTPLGRIVILIAASGLLIWHGVPVLGPLALVLIFIWPDQRRSILSLAAVLMVFDRFFVRQGLEYSASSFAAIVDWPVPWLKVLVLTAATVFGLYLVYQIARNFQRLPSPVRKSPFVFLHLGVAGTFGLVYVFPGLFVIAELIPWLLWRICFLLQFAQRGKIAETRFTDHLFYLWPMVGSSGSPYGKGLAYLSSREAKDDSTFAAARLSGLKLLVLAAVWELVLQLFNMVIYGQPQERPAFELGMNLGLPTLTQAVVAENTGILTAWISVLVELIRIVLHYAVIGHVIVGFLRLCGFNIYRNTYKPLLSESIIEFWGRFNYYFKELMVEFFFYPTFLKARRLNKHLRLLLAVFAAAFIGNMYYHVIETPVLIGTGDLSTVWEVWGPRLIYCLALTIGIWVSMLRQQKARGASTEKSLPQRLRSIAGVWVFYGVIRVWNLDGDYLTWENRAQFTLKLFGLSSMAWFQ
jgi:hypothetical protein